MAKRSKSPQFRVTPEEDAHLRQAAADAGMKLSDYLRAVTLHPTVVVVDGLNVTLIPSTVTLPEADEALRARFRAILTELKRPAPSGVPLATPAPSEQPQAQGAPPASSGTADAGMVGASSSAAAPVSPSQEAGASPGESQPAVSQIERCPHCGGTEGRHQSFCETVRGEPPVAPVAEEQAPPQPPGMEEYVQRRVDEGELRVVAEAEWRQGQGQQAPSPAADPERRQACPSCGTMKLPEVQCPDCGRRPG